MTDKDEKISRIVIEFRDAGSAEPNLYAENVTPAQIVIAGRVVQMMGERQLHQMWHNQDMERMKKAGDLAQVQAMIRGDKH